MKDNTAKQEAIRKAYGEYWETYKDLVDDNGWFANRFTGNDIQNKQLDFRTEKDDKQHPFRFRIKGLQGIENNNGWISIESEDDLPKHTDENLIFNVITKSGKMIICYVDKFTDRICKYGSKQPVNGIRYYQVLNKPKNPIY